MLIHAASGGVGLAAVQLALQAGAEIYATAGNPEKRAYLKSLGVPYVMDSRSLTFADQIMEWTGGEGVDVILNSLIDDFIHKSFGVLKPGGLFLEIGKRGIWSLEQVQDLGKNHQYHVVFLGQVCIDEHALIQSMLKTLASGLSNKSLKPLPIRNYAIKDAEVAFRYMAQARHIGKIVLTMPAIPETNLKHHLSKVDIRDNASYLITGGLGGVGIGTAEWLAYKGAKSIVLVSRSLPSPEISQKLEHIRSTGTVLTVIQGDVANEEDVRRILHEIKASLPPLKGIFHAAGVVGDGLFQEMDWEKCERVLAPKVYGAWNLHIQTADLPLDLFVLFSAGASLFGSAGQSNYASANAFLDALAHFRRAKGMPALSINWGPWAEIGMAARSSKFIQRRWAEQGIYLISPNTCFHAMERLFSVNAIQAGVFDIEWPVFFNQYASGQKPSFFFDLAITEPVRAHEKSIPAEENDILVMLASASPTEREDVLEKHLKKLVARVIGYKTTDNISMSLSMSEMGIDSLMTIELRNRIQDTLNIALPLRNLFGTTTLSDLKQHLIALLWTAKEVQATSFETDGEREDFDL